MEEIQNRRIEGLKDDFSLIALHPRPALWNPQESFDVSEKIVATCK